MEVCDCLLKRVDLNVRFGRSGSEYQSEFLFCSFCNLLVRVKFIAILISVVSWTFLLLYLSQTKAYSETRLFILLWFDFWLSGVGKGTISARVLYLLLCMTGFRLSFLGFWSSHAHLHFLTYVVLYALCMDFPPTHLTVVLSWNILIMQMNWLEIMV